MNIRDFYLVDFLLVLFYVYAADAIRCFQCDYSKPGCESLKRMDLESPYLLPCNAINGSSFCRKTIQTVLANVDTVRITRECGWLTIKPNVTKCFKYDTHFKFDTTCQCFEDGCNSSLTIAPKYFVLFATTILSFCRLF